MSNGTEDNVGDGTEPYRGGFWLPPRVEYDLGPQDEYPQDMRPVTEKHVQYDWTLKFPISMGGLFAQTSAVKRPTNGGDYQTTYGLKMARFYDSVSGPDDPGYLTREELTYLRDLLSAVLEDSREMGSEV